MAPPTVQTAPPSGEPIFRDVGQLVVGDVIAAAYLPLRRPGRVIFVRAFERPCINHRPDERWVFVAVEYDSGMHDGVSFLAGEGVRLDVEGVRVCNWCDSGPTPNPANHPNGHPEHVVDPTGLNYGRGDEGVPQPTGRVRPHFEAAVGGVGESVVLVPVLDVPMRDEKPRGDDACPTHGKHPHQRWTGLRETCLDCPICRPAAS